MKKNILLCAILCMQVYYAKSQTNISAELRPRLIIDDGYKSPKIKDNNTVPYITQRTRLNVNKKSDLLDAYISIQDIRYWGDEDNYKSSGALSNTKSLDLNEAWFKYKPSDLLTFKIGRQIFKYDDQRIISSRGWNDYQVKYDALLFVYQDSLNKLDLGISYNSETNKNLLYPEDKFRTFDFIRYERLLNNFTISAISVITGNTTSDTTEAITLKGTHGANLNYKYKYSKVRISGYYQHNLDKKQKDVSAYSISFYVTQKINNKIKIGTGIDYLSGQDENNGLDYQNTNHAFDILYGRRHGWYGYMDYFSTMPEQGLQDYMIKSEFKIVKNTTCQIDYHHFQLAADKINPDLVDKVINRNLGDEIDFTIVWNPIKEMTLQAGYSFYLLTKSTGIIKGIDNKNARFPQFFYTMITISPKIL